MAVVDAVHAHSGCVVMLTLAVPPSAAIIGGAVAVSPHLPAASGAGVSDEEDSVQAPIKVAAASANATAIEAQRYCGMVGGRCPSKRYSTATDRNAVENRRVLAWGVSEMHSPHSEKYPASRKSFW